LKNRAYAVFQALDAMTPEDVGAARDEDGGPPFLRFDPDAQELFDSWRAGLEARLRAPDENPLIESHLSKYRSLMPSLAELFHLIEVTGGAGPGPVGIRAAAMAVAWCEYLEAHMRRAYASVADPDLEPARALAERIKAGELPDPFTYRDVYRRCWSQLDDSDAVHRAVTILDAYGWVRAVDSSTGGRPRTDIHIHLALPRKAPEGSERHRTGD
jgi:putative DNA primase/helicase